MNGLSGNAAASHIHLGAAGTNGGIVYPFTAASLQTGQVASGTIDLNQPVSNGTSSISGDSLLTLLEANRVAGSVLLSASTLELNENTIGGSLLCSNGTLILPREPDDDPVGNTVRGTNTCGA